MPSTKKSSKTTKNTKTVETEVSLKRSVLVTIELPTTLKVDGKEMSVKEFLDMETDDYSSNSEILSAAITDALDDLQYED